MMWPFWIVSGLIAVWFASSNCEGVCQKELSRLVHAGEAGGNSVKGLVPPGPPPPLFSKTRRKAGIIQSTQKDAQRYKELDIGSAALIRAIVTKGCGEDPGCHRGIRYRLLYSLDRTNWQFLSSNAKGNTVFTRDNDCASSTRQELGCPVIAQYVRILPYSADLPCSIEVAFIGCHLQTEEGTGRVPVTTSQVDDTDPGLNETRVDTTDPMTTVTRPSSYTDTRLSTSVTGERNHTTTAAPVTDSWNTTNFMPANNTLKIVSKKTSIEYDSKENAGNDTTQVVIQITSPAIDNKTEGIEQHTTADIGNAIISTPGSAKRPKVNTNNATTQQEKGVLTVMDGNTTQTEINDTQSKTDLETSTESVKATSAEIESTYKGVKLLSNAGVTNTPGQTRSTVGGAETDGVRTTGCVSDCEGREDGHYHSCSSCTMFASCAGGVLADHRPCPSSLVWDDRRKRCVYHSDTCLSQRPQL